MIEIGLRQLEEDGIIIIREEEIVLLEILDITLKGGITIIRTEVKLSLQVILRIQIFRM